jgi:hypothetical protein
MRKCRNFPDPLRQPHLITKQMFQPLKTHDARRKCHEDLPWHNSRSALTSRGAPAAPLSSSSGEAGPASTGGARRASGRRDRPAGIFLRAASCQRRSARSSSDETLDTRDSGARRSVLMEAAPRLAPRGRPLRCCCSSASCSSRASSFDTTAATATVVPAGHVVV